MLLKDMLARVSLDSTIHVHVHGAVGEVLKEAATVASNFYASVVESSTGG